MVDESGEHATCTVVLAGNALVLPPPLPLLLHLAGACVLRLDDGHVHWDDGGQDANNMPCHF